MIGFEHRSYLSHFGAILSNLAIGLLAFCFLGLFFMLFSWVVPAFLILLWFIATVFTLGLALLDESFRSFPGTAMDSLSFIGDVGNYIWEAMPYAFFGGLICSVLSIVFVLMDPSPRKSYWRVGIAATVLLLLVAVAVIIVAGVLYEVGGGAE